MHRFWEKVYRHGDDECWLWIGHIRSDGYAGQFSFNGRRQLARQWAWEFTHGPVPPGHVVICCCGRKSCVNPRHMSISKKNDLRLAAKVTEQQVAQIRALARQPNPPTTREIAEQFGVSNQLVYLILAGKTWVGVGNPGTELAGDTSSDGEHVEVRASA